jgi:hypothetical protein
MESETHIRLMMNMALFKSYLIFLCVLSIFLLLEAGPFVVILLPTMAVQTLPLMLANMLLFSIFADYFYRWHFEYSIAIPLVVAPLIWWIVGPIFPIGITAIIAMITLPIASINFMKKEESQASERRMRHNESAPERTSTSQN